MKIRKREPILSHDEEVLYDVALSRFKKLTVMDALDWCDLAGSGMARALDDYRRTGNQDSLIEAKHGAVQVLAAIDLLVLRS